MLANYHTHTNRNGHTTPDGDEAYIEAAIQAGMSVLGFADHTPWPYENGYTHKHVRMYVEELPEYIRSINALKEKYRDRIHIYVGLECEYFPAYWPWLTGVKDQLDYLILGNHYPLTDIDDTPGFGHTSTPDRLRLYARYTLRAMQTGLFRYVAHPDMPLGEYPVFDATCEVVSRLICEEALERNLPLEYNLHGMDKKRAGRTHGIGYPCARFWEIAAETGNTAILGWDAHAPGQLVLPELVDEAVSHLDSLGIKRIETLEGLE